MDATADWVADGQSSFSTRTLQLCSDWIEEQIEGLSACHRKIDGQIEGLSAWHPD